MSREFMHAHTVPSLVGIIRSAVLKTLNRRTLASKFGSKRTEMIGGFVSYC